MWKTDPWLMWPIRTIFKRLQMLAGIKVRVKDNYGKKKER